MTEVKVGDTFSRCNNAFNKKFDTRTVVKVSDKSIWFQDLAGNTFRIKNSGKDSYYMSADKDGDYKVMYYKD